MRRHLTNIIRGLLTGARPTAVGTPPATEASPVDVRSNPPVRPWWRRRSRWLWCALIAVVVAAAVLAFMLAPRGELDCGDIQTACLKLDLNTDEYHLKCFTEKTTKINAEAVANLQSFSGRALLPAPAEENECSCKWQLGTSSTAWTDITSEGKCVFSFKIPPGVKTFRINLYVDKQLKEFTFDVIEKKSKSKSKQT